MSRFFTKSQQLQYEGKRKKKVPAALTPIHFIWRQEHITEREHRKKRKKERNVPLLGLQRLHLKHKCMGDELCSCPPPDSPFSLPERARKKFRINFK